MNTQNPFGLALVSWREVRFVPGSAKQLTYSQDPLGPIHITLPETLGDAVEKRRSEFLVGRVCAGLALRGLGLPEDVGQNGRMPVWPQGAVGSISHTDRRAIAVVSRALKGLGVDCEDVMPADQAQVLHPIIMTSTEAHLQPRDLSFAAYLTLVFSAKEAVYKALSGGLNRVLEFHEVTLINVTPDRLRFSFEGAVYETLYRLEGSKCLTLVQVP